MAVSKNHILHRNINNHIFYATLKVEIQEHREVQSRGSSAVKAGQVYKKQVQLKRVI